MDRDRFDNLAKLLATSGSRRATLGALLGTLVGPHAAETVAKERGKEKGKDRGRGRDRSRDQDREREQLQAQGRQGSKRRKHKKKRGGRGNDGGGQTPPPPPDGCCGTESCPDPEPGSTHSGCDHAGRSFVGQDHNGSTFRGIDGREANFNQTDNHGSVFAEACLQGASFRRAKLGGSTWGGACLFGADFTGADLGNESAVFAGALFCGTTMPDSSVNDRDCGRETACCRAQPAPACQTAADCGDEACRTKACANGQCVYTVITDGASPNDECGANASGHCCEGVCCQGNATECNPLGICCAPNCAGRDCGNDGCGGTCGACPAGEACDDDSGQCLCTRQSCPNGCCANGPGNPGPCQSGDTIQACGSDGAACAVCASGNGCLNQQCTTCNPPCPTGLGLRCNAAGRCVCDEQSCPNGCCFSNSGGSICLDGEVDDFCGSDGETCVDCGAGARCLGHVCVCLAGLCAGCCENGPGNPGRCLANTPPVCGVDGNQCTACSTGDGRTCNGQGQCVCNLQSCPTGCCSDGAGNPGICVERQCTQDTDCPNVRDCVCDRAEGTCCTRNCDGKVCGPDGCGGDCENLCPANTVCSPDGTECLCTAQSCPNGCCSNGLGEPGTCEEGDTNAACGRPGQACQTCTGQEQCENRQCVCIPKTCAALGRSCGTAPDGCGGTLECGSCPLGNSSSCNSNGVCVSCDDLCGGAFCLNLTNGDSVCCGCVPVNCALGCSSNADCASETNGVCLTSFTADTDPITTVASICGAGVPAICAPLIDCFGPNCGGSQ